MAVRHGAEDPDGDPLKLEAAELKKGLTYLQVNLHYFTSNSALRVAYSNLNLECEQHGNGLPGQKQTGSIDRGAVAL